MLQFTKEIKEKWLNALKSGEYKHGTKQLIFNFENVTTHCCLGVLAEIHPELSLNKFGDCLYEGNHDGYQVFKDMFGSNNTEILWKVNDNEKQKAKGYNRVIPIIEQLPTVD